MYLKLELNIGDMVPITVDGKKTVAIILDHQKRSCDYAYLMEALDTHELIVAWPIYRSAEEVELRPMSSRHIDDNPNVNTKRKCFASRAYVL